MAIDLPAAVVAFITALESVAGVQIATLERVEKTEEFWVNTASILCEKTGDPWCEEHVRFMTSNTEPMGQSQIIEYDFDGTGPKRVCAIIPPLANVDPLSIAESYGGPIPSVYETPTSLASSAWLMLYHAAHCLDGTLTDDEENRAAAFATLGLTILAGDPTFAPGMHRAGPRQIAVMTGRPAAYWAAGAGERVLLNHWKAQAAERLRSMNNCYVTIGQNTSIDIERIVRDMTIPHEETCSMSVDEGGYRSTTVRANITDANLWLWMYGPQGNYIDGSSWAALGAPPVTYTAAQPFQSMEHAVTYVLETANALSR